MESDREQSRIEAGTVATSVRQAPHAIRRMALVFSICDSPALARMLVHLATIDLEALTELDIGLDPDRVFILAFEEIDDHGFQIGGLNVGFPVDRPFRPKSSTTRYTF